ncbi:uncharacterized protein LOC62_06G008566 [Vanrija pseudolonga]|uniref:Uncharacterized protein n=1 Tax=Vanrija pseudolonga TaxID=143232 RepID=A0AAF1BP47_9TREE|nr:hypothetical protein LOC62_06G008566 [Vanrija pseudolonga]
MSDLILGQTAPARAISDIDITTRTALDTWRGPSRRPGPPLPLPTRAEGLAQRRRMEESPVGRYMAAKDRAAPPSPERPLPPITPADAAVIEAMVQATLDMGRDADADATTLRPTMARLYFSKREVAEIKWRNKAEQAQRAHSAQWREAHPRTGLFSRGPPTPPLPPPPPFNPDILGEYKHMLHGGGMYGGPVPGCTYCAPMLAARERLAREFDDNQAALRAARERRWARRVAEWRGPEVYDHARAAAVADRFGVGWDELQGGAAWDEAEAEWDRLHPYSQD